MTNAFAETSSQSDVVDLSEDGLLALARARTGLSDFGDDGFREGLRALLAMYTTTARLTPQGRKATQRRLVELLANRSLIARAFHEHPEIRNACKRLLLGVPYGMTPQGLAAAVKIPLTDAREIYAVIDHLKTASRQQIDRSHALVTIIADTDHFVERLVDQLRRGAFPKRRAGLNLTGRSRMVIGEEHLLC